MTRAVCNRILKDATSDTSDHLCNHIHLTNNVHLKSHLHKLSPILHNKSLVRDLIVLQRSRSLRDPSASPPLWHSTIIADLLSKDSENVENGERYGKRLSPPLWKVVDDGNKTFGGDDIVSSNKLPNENEWFQGASRNSERRVKNSATKGKYNKEIDYKTLSQHLNEISLDGDEVASSNKLPNRRRSKAETTFLEEADPSIRGSYIGLNRVTRSKPRRVERAENELSMATTSSIKGKMHKRHDMGVREDELDELNVSKTPQSRCGIPFNWSRIHHSGKSFLDMAGRSLSCGLSDPRLNSEGQACQARDTADFMEASEQSSSCSKPNAEAMPLLVDESASQGTSDNVAWAHDYSGDLGIKSDGGHQNLTQKYMPQTFRDLVGQNLVAKALSNAIVRRKLGFLYVYYGPHGTGKTSTARIFARALNCQSREHLKPCGSCGSCKAHVMGKSRNIKEVCPVSNFDFKSIVDMLNSMVITQQASQYRVLIFDDCDTVSPDFWIAISELIDRAPRRVVFVLVCSSLDVLPHIIISRCQKFFFPKLKDADIIYALQWIATKEGVEIDKEALELIASRSDGSLRDAEMTLEQLILLGQRISVTLVQELVGMISDEKLVDLLDLALSANTIRTIKKLREIVESGVEPLALMSQLATVITDILAGSYDFKKEKRKRKFFQQQALSEEDMKKLRQALKTLSQAEKRLRLSNDKLTWLTAALLQLAPDQQHTLQTSSVKDTSFDQRQLALNDRTDAARKCRSEHLKLHNNGICLSADSAAKKLKAGSPGTSKMSRSRKQGARKISHMTSARGHTDKAEKEIENIWLNVLKNIEVNCIKEFMCEGKLTYVSYGAAPTVQLLFSSPQTKSKAEMFRAYILQAFESVLGSPVTVEIRCNSRKDGRMGVHELLTLPRPENGSSQVNIRSDSLVHRTGYIGSSTKISQNQGHSGTYEGVELGASLRKQELNDLSNTTFAVQRGGVSLVPVIHQTKGSPQHRPWTKHKAVSIAEKLEEENMRLESKSRTLLCWKTSRATRRKLSRSKTRTCRRHTLLKLLICGKYLSSLSSR